jgi:predicted metallo-beta-lactamase superfamily hydrolase
VKEFINKFILAEKEVQIDALKQNIRTLKEYENLMKETKEKIKKLEVILDSFKNYEKKTADLQVNEVLIRKANYERVLSEMDAEKEELETVLQSLRHTIALQDEVTEQYRHEQNLFSELQITLRNE